MKQTAEKAPSPQEALDHLVAIIFNRCPTVEIERRDILQAKALIEEALKKE